MLLKIWRHYCVFSCQSLFCFNFTKKKIILILFAMLHVHYVNFRERARKIWSLSNVVNDNKQYFKFSLFLLDAQNFAFQSISMIETEGNFYKRQLDSLCNSPFRRKTSLGSRPFTSCFSNWRVWDSLKSHCKISQMFIKLSLFWYRAAPGPMTPAGT